jgi:hypothetical protein
VKKGERLMVASEPFCKLNEGYEPPVAGSLSEQFSLASCIYTIRFRHKPSHHLDAPTRVRKLIMNEFPSSSTDSLFGDLTCKCWHGVYDSIGAVEQDILSRLRGRPGAGEYPRNETVGQMDDMEPLMLLTECEEFLAKESQRTKDGR